MAIRNIRELGDDILRKNCREVKEMTPKIQELIAEVPMGEMGDFSTVLRSVTAGRGWFSLEFTRYEDAPPVVAQKVIDVTATDTPGPIVRTIAPASPL